MRVLLDTHALLWHYEDSAELSPSAKSVINNPQNRVFISAASIWEAAIKFSLGKLRLEAPIRHIVEGYVRTGATLLSMTPDHALATAALPWLHRDPFDRMLIAQGQHEGLTLITRDDLIRQYDVRHTW